MAYDLSQLKVLLVDSNRQSYQIVLSILAAMRIEQVHSVETLEDAARELRNWSPDLVVTELLVGEEDALTFIGRVRRGDNESDPFVPVILLTGRTEAARIRTARDTGVNEILAKPVAAAGLYDRIVEIIENPRPFVRTKSFFGPDRRRRDRPFDGECRRDGNKKNSVA